MLFRSTYELAWEQALGPHFKASVGAYWNQIDDLISRERDVNTGLPWVVNHGSVAGRGAEFEVEGRAESGLRGRLSYSLQRTEDTETRQELGNSPRHLGKLNIAVPICSQKVFAGFELRYQSSVRTVYATQSPSFWVANATLFSKDIVKGLELSASVYNIFDRQYYNPGGPEHAWAVMPQIGRQLMFKATYRF